MGTQHTNNVIAINGQRYDAVTGAYLGEQAAAVQASRSVARPVSRGVAIDGFRRPNRNSSQAPAQPLTPIPAKAAHKVVPVPAPKPRKAHQPGITAAAHTPQPAKTLMRSAVKKPVIKSPEVIKAQTRTDILAKVPEQVVKPKLSHTNVDHKRMRRAERVIQSPAVRKYNHTPAQQLPAHLVTPAVQAQPAPVTTPKPAAAVQPAPVRSELRTPRPAFNNQHQVRSAVRKQQPAIPVQQAPQQISSDIFEKAIAEASTHKQSHKRSKGFSRFGTAAAVTAIMLLLVGFLGYQNLPYINVRVAAYKAGIQAKMPTYSPTGFSFGSLKYTPGSVTVSYYSEKDATQSLNISQKSSDWNSKALLDNFVATTTKSYETIERAGRTIYVYGNNTATWVDNGIWYTISGNNTLSDSQILDVALSI